MSKDSELAQHQLRADLLIAGFIPSVNEIEFRKGKNAKISLDAGGYTSAELRFIADWIDRRDTAPILSREEE